MAIGVVHFTAMLLLVSAILRLFTLKFPNNPASHALMFALG